MSIKVAINGYGRIGRNVLRALYESNRNEDITIVAINDLTNLDTNVHLTKYDTTFGPFHGEVKTDGERMIVNGDSIAVYAQRDPAKLPWEELEIDVVLECSGFFTSKEAASAHLTAGAKKVLVSAPAKNADKTIVFGVNHHTLSAEDRVVSNASCTTNCLAPIAKILNDTVGIESGLMTTVHAYTNDQKLIDSSHKDLRRARSATHSMIPTKTGAAIAVGLVLPELNGKLDGFAIRVPTINVSMVDLTFQAERETNIDEINEAILAASQNSLRDILGYNEAPLVSVDFNHNPNSSTFDATQTRVMGRLVKVVSWYDNEWGFSNRMLDTCLAMAKQ